MPKYTTLMAPISLSLAMQGVVALLLHKGGENTDGPDASHLNRKTKKYLKS